MLCSDGGSVGYLAAAFAGLVSFLSPCVLPLVPGYLSAVSGVPPTELEGVQARRVLGPSLLFVASFSAIFIVLFGLPASLLGSALTEHRETVDRVSAVLLVLMGIFFVLSSRVLAFNREFRVPGLLERAGRGGPIVAGAAFALAWTPCIGPTLSAISTLALNSGSKLHGIVLLAVYSLGLAVPFVLTGLFFGYMTSAFERVKRHYGVVMVLGGALLVTLGVLLFTGDFAALSQNLSGVSGIDC